MYILFLFYISSSHSGIITNLKIDHFSWLTFPPNVISLFLHAKGRFWVPILLFFYLGAQLMCILRRRYKIMLDTSFPKIES